MAHLERYRDQQNPTQCEDQARREIVCAERSEDSRLEHMHPSAVGGIDDGPGVKSVCGEAVFKKRLPSLGRVDRTPGEKGEAREDRVEGDESPSESLRCALAMYRKRYLARARMSTRANVSVSTGQVCEAKKILQ